MDKDELLGSYKGQSIALLQCDKMGKHNRSLAVALQVRSNNLGDPLSLTVSLVGEIALTSDGTRVDSATYESPRIVR